MHYHGHRERLRARFDKAPSELADYEILELFLGSVITRRDTKPLAKLLLEKFGSVKGALDAKPAELLSLEGFGAGLLRQWVLQRELMARYAESALRKRQKLISPSQVAQIAMTRLAGNPNEEIWVLFVDSQNSILAWEKTGHGTADRSNFYIREVLERAIVLKASGLCMVHNHPSGHSMASNADVDMTKKLINAAREIGIRFIDHLVITDNSYSSMVDEQLL